MKKKKTDKMPDKKKIAGQCGKKPQIFIYDLLMSL